MGGPRNGTWTWPPCVWPATVSEARPSISGKTSGSCTENDRRRACWNSVERLLHPLLARELIGEADDVEMTSAIVDGEDLVLEHHDAVLAKLSRQRVPVVVPVVVAEHRDHSERRPEPAEHGRDGLEGDPRAERDLVDHVVAREQHEVRLFGVRSLDELTHAFHAPVQASRREDPTGARPSARRAPGASAERRARPGS